VRLEKIKKDIARIDEAIESNNLEEMKNLGFELYQTYWNEIPDLITPNQPPINVLFIRLYFVGMLIVGGIFGLSFVNAVLVDSMVQDNTDDLESKVDALRDEISELKDLLQANNSPKE